MIFQRIWEMEHHLVYKDGHVALGAMRREYIEQLMPWVNDPEVTSGILLRPPITLETEQEWYEALSNRHASDVFAILIQSNGGSGDTGEWRYVGHTGVHFIKWPDGTGSTGSFIGDATLHGEGVGTRAKLLLLRHAFYSRGLRKICSEVKAFNAKSLGHLLKTGYRIVGVRKEHCFHNGAYVDEVILEVFKYEFDCVWRLYKETGELPKLTEKQRLEVQRICT